MANGPFWTLPYLYIIIPFTPFSEYAFIDSDPYFSLRPPFSWTLPFRQKIIRRLPMNCRSSMKSLLCCGKRSHMRRLLRGIIFSVTVSLFPAGCPPWSIPSFPSHAPTCKAPVYSSRVCCTLSCSPAESCPSLGADSTPPSR